MSIKNALLVVLILFVITAVGLASVYFYLKSEQNQELKRLEIENQTKGFSDLQKLMQEDAKKKEVLTPEKEERVNNLSELLKTAEEMDAKKQTATSTATQPKPATTTQPKPASIEEELDPETLEKKIKMENIMKNFPL